MVFRDSGTWTRQAGRQEEAVMMAPARDHWVRQSRGARNEGSDIGEVGEVTLVESCFPGDAYWLGEQIFLDGERVG